MKQIETRKLQFQNLFRAREVVTVGMLCLSMFVTYTVWSAARRTAEQTLQTAFEFRVRESNTRIQQRLAVYEQVLRSTVGLFSAARVVSRAEFHTFVGALSLGDRFPGIEGIGFSLLLRPEQLTSHVAGMRGEGFPDYTIKPPGKRDLYSAIIYLEPFYGRNLRAFGYDMFSEPVRRKAMELARDIGGTALSGKVRLVQESRAAEVQAGFLMYLPVYHGGAPLGTIEQRRAALAGWVYAPFRMEDFMRGMGSEQQGDIDIEVYDGDQLSDAALLYDSDRSRQELEASYLFKKIDRIEAGQRTWTVVSIALPSFEERIRSDRPQLILQSGISIGLLLTLLVWLFLDDRARALQAAAQAMQLALYDALTGLPNRKLLEERLERELSKSKRSHGHVALLFIDLDKFKPVNDNFGHAYGDLLLKEVANRLHSCMRESDTASRLGGDEFVALLPDIEGAGATRLVAAKILERLTEPYEIAGHTFEISASIGAAISPEDGADVKSLVKSADLAMYDAKNAGRANIKFARSSPLPHR